MPYRTLGKTASTTLGHSSQEKVIVGSTRNIEPIVVFVWDSGSASSAPIEIEDLLIGESVWRLCQNGHGVYSLILGKRASAILDLLPRERDIVEFRSCMFTKSIIHLVTGLPISARRGILLNLAFDSVLKHYRDGHGTHCLMPGMRVSDTSEPFATGMDIVVFQPRTRLRRVIRSVDGSLNNDLEEMPWTQTAG
jgi:hypothetical protein